MAQERDIWGEDALPGRGEQNPDQQTEAVQQLLEEWELLGCRLAAVLSLDSAQVGAHAEGDQARELRFACEIPTVHGAEIVQIQVDPEVRGGLLEWGEQPAVALGAGAWLTKASRAVLIAEQIVDQLRVVAPVPDPRLMVWRPPADRREQCVAVGLAVRADTPPDHEPAAAPDRRARGGVWWPHHADHLRSLIETAIPPFLTVHLDECGEFEITGFNFSVWVRLTEDRCGVEVPVRQGQMIEIYAPVLVGVGAAEVADREINLLNQHSGKVQWYRSRTVIYQRRMVPAVPFVPLFFVEALQEFFEVFARSCPDLIERVGGWVLADDDPHGA